MNLTIKYIGKRNQKALSKIRRHKGVVNFYLLISLCFFHSFLIEQMHLLNTRPAESPQWQLEESPFESKSL